MILNRMHVLWTVCVCTWERGLYSPITILKAVKNSYKGPQNLLKSPAEAFLLLPKVSLVWQVTWENSTKLPLLRKNISSVSLLMTLTDLELWVITGVVPADILEYRTKLMFTLQHLQNRWPESEDLWQVQKT